MLLKIIPLALMLLPVSDSDLPKQFKDAQTFVTAVAEKMPLWDADKLGQFERHEIQAVKNDIMAAQQETDADDFLIDVEQLRKDWDILLALDEALNHERIV